MDFKKGDNQVSARRRERTKEREREGEMERCQFTGVNAVVEDFKNY